MLSSAEKLGSPQRSIVVILVSGFIKMSGMILSILSGKFSLSLMNLGKWKKR